MVRQSISKELPLTRTQPYFSPERHGRHSWMVNYRHTDESIGDRLASLVAETTLWRLVRTFRTGFVLFSQLDPNYCTCPVKGRVGQRNNVIK